MSEISDRAYFSSMGTAMVIEVVLTTLTKRGSGKPGENSPIRLVTQYWSKKGDLLAEKDSFDEQSAIINDLVARCKLADDANQRLRVENSALRQQSDNHAAARVTLAKNLDAAVASNHTLAVNAQRQIARLKAKLKRASPR